MGCCCSCCCKPVVELERHAHKHIKQHLHQRPGQPAQAQGRQNAPRSGPTAVPPTGMPSDHPPPYESDAVQLDTVGSVGGSRQAGSSAFKDLPYVIPLTSAGAGTRSDDSLAAAYVNDLKSLGVPPSQYLEFLSGLDHGLFAAPTIKPGSVSAYIQSMFQDQGDLSWHSSTTTDSIGRSNAYVAEKNAEIFHNLSLHVEVLATKDMKQRLDSVSQATLSRAEGNRQLSEIEAKLLTSKTLQQQQKAMRKYLEKDEKYTQRALNAGSTLNNAGASDGGVYWLLVTSL